MSPVPRMAATLLGTPRRGRVKYKRPERIEQNSSRHHVRFVELALRLHVSASAGAPVDDSLLHADGTRESGRAVPRGAHRDTFCDDLPFHRQEC